MSARAKPYKDKDWFIKSRERSKNIYYSSSGMYERRAWTLNEERIIMESEKSDRQLSKELHRSVRSIQTHRWHIRKMEGSDAGVHKQSKKTVSYVPSGNKANKRWTPEEERVLMDENLSVTEMAVILDRTVKSVDGHRCYMRRKKEKE